MYFLDTLFGNKTWCDPHRTEFSNAFDDTYVNFGHWIVTKDPLPAAPVSVSSTFWSQASVDSILRSHLLANLWSRGGGLQCCFNQESLDLMFVTYKGSVAVDEIFDVANLSTGVVQIKYKTDTDTQAGPALRPMGIPHNTHQPLPYFTFLMELGAKSPHRATQASIKATPSPSLADGAFEKLQCEWMDALKELNTYRSQKEIKQQRKRGQDATEKKLLQAVHGARVNMDAYNRFMVSVRGASSDVYGILKTANIAEEFASLLSVTMPSPTTQDTAIQCMRPLERLGETAHTAWMSTYVVGGSEDEPMDVDT